MTRKRIWELDALRGICILGMVAIHAAFDLVDLLQVVSWQFPPLLSFIQNWGGVLFLLISGICATLGSRSVRRGLIVFTCGMIVTAVTMGLYLLGFADQSIIIYFGVLHCLGVCMMLWHFLRKFPSRALGVLGGVLAAVGLILRRFTVDTPYLIWLGLTFPGFATADYFPLLPHLGFFLLGAFLGRTLYRKQESLLPRAPVGNPMIRFACFCGRHSLAIYLLHQPVFALLATAVAWLLR